MINKTDWLVEREITLGDQTVIYSYDKEGDVLEILFQKGGGLGVDLTENIALRYNRENGEPLSLILTNYSRLIKPTPYGLPSFRLSALTTLPSEMQQTVLSLLNSWPVNHFLKVSGLFVSPGGELQPITYLDHTLDLSSDKVFA